MADWEVKFDRLALIFSQLEQGQSCWIKIKAIKAFEGKPFLTPVRFWPMYKGDVWGVLLR